MSQIGKKLQHEEDETGTTRYTLAYPELPQELSKLLDGDISTEIVPDYSNVSVDDLYDDDNDNDNDNYNDNVNDNDNSSTFVSRYANQGGYDAQLDWEPEKTKLLHDSLFTQDALLRRALIGGIKGSILGLGVGVVISLWAKRFLSLTQEIPISFHVYTLGCGAFMFGGMNAVHQAKRYKEYIGFKQSGVANPQAIGLKDAKNQMADWMSAAYSPQYVEQWRESEEAEQQLQKQMAGIRT